MRYLASNIELTTEVNHRYLILVCSIAASCQFATGYEIGSVNAVFYSDGILFTSLYMIFLLIGLTLGSLTVKFMCFRFGRRCLLIVASCVLLVGISLVGSRQNLLPYSFTSFIARVIDGFACGIGSTVAPIYSNSYPVKELSPSELSGKYGGLNQVFFTLGVCSAASGQLFKFVDTGALYWWQVSYMVFIFLILVHITLLIFILPDSPHWHYEKGNKDKAKEIIRRIMSTLLLL
jgi:MFS family permease